ncbi:MAG: CoA-binding protein, partial [Acidobacteriaceae bacterium]|nr:CoA-binding protein [Acidobacteriaceae bacterium]
MAIVGASSTPGALGESVLRNLENAKFSGDLYLINPKRTEIRGHSCLPSIDSLPEGVDCAVLAIPRAGVMDAVKACGRRAIGGVIIFSAGFAESGPEGRAEQEELAQIAREHNMILEGPNCLGMVNGIDVIALTFVLTTTERLADQRGLAVVSQSGAMAAVLGVSLRKHGLGISFSISTGNEASTGVEDYVEYLIEDAQTHMIAMIVELFRQPRRFLELARRARECGKYIVLLHPGRSSAARASAATHTGAMAGDYELMRTKVTNEGVLVVDTLEELIDVSQLLIRCSSVPRGGAAVLTESGAFKALTLDFCEAVRLPLPSLSAKTAGDLKLVLPDFIPPTNPLDITAQGLVDPDLYRRTLPAFLKDEQYGSVVLGIILTDESTSALKFPPILDALRALETKKPVIFAALDEGAQISPAYVEQLRALGVPFFPSPERAFRALARLTEAAQNDPQHPALAFEAFELCLPGGVLPE